MEYPDGLRARLIRRMAGSERISACALAKESGIPQPTLSRWLREASTVTAMLPPHEPKKSSWSAEEKLRVVTESLKIPSAELGEFLRKEGLHSAQLEEWRRDVLAVLATPVASKPKVGDAEHRKRIKRLERELLRKDRALAEVTALLALQKKVRELWGDADDDTDTKSGT